MRSPNKQEHRRTKKSDDFKESNTGVVKLLTLTPQEEKIHQVSGVWKENFPI